MARTGELTRYPVAASIKGFARARGLSYNLLGSYRTRVDGKKKEKTGEPREAGETESSASRGGGRESADAPTRWIRFREPRRDDAAHIFARHDSLFTEFDTRSLSHSRNSLKNCHSDRKTYLYILYNRKTMGEGRAGREEKKTVRKTTISLYTEICWPTRFHRSSTISACE